MEAADNMEFCYRLGPALASDPKGFLEGHRVSGGRVGLAAEGAEPATGHAHIRWVEVPIDVEIGPLPVQFLAHVVGKVTKVTGDCKGQILAIKVLKEFKVNLVILGQMEFRVFKAVRDYKEQIRGL